MYVKSTFFKGEFVANLLFFKTKHNVVSFGRLGLRVVFYIARIGSKGHMLHTSWDIHLHSPFLQISYRNFPGYLVNIVSKVFT